MPAHSPRQNIGATERQIGGPDRRAGRLRRVPPITGRVEVSLTVRDPVRSAEWYKTLFDMETLYEFVAPDGNMSYFCLTERGSGLVLCLVGHATNGEPFSEYRTGLDHLEFLVPRREDLDNWASRLDELGIEHSGVKQPRYTQNSMLTFRDPDNIQLEFFWRAPSCA